jgi:hypothetical protein
MTTCEMTTSLGPYLLGAVEFDEWSDIDRHLQQCELCQAEVVRLAGLPGLMGKIPLDEVLAFSASSEVAPPPVQAKRAGGLRLMRSGPLMRTGLLMRAGVAAVVIAILAVFGLITVSRQPASSWSHTFALEGANPLTHVSGGASLTAETWGTEIWVKLRGVPPGLECQLMVRARDGRTVVGGAWASGTANGAWIPATAPFGPSQIASLEIAAPPKHLLTLTGDIDASAKRLTEDG